MPVPCECRSFAFLSCSVLAYVFFISFGDISLSHGVTTKHNGWRIMESNNLAIQKNIEDSISMYSLQETRIGDLLCGLGP